MSEVSESLHLWKLNRTDALDVLRQRHLAGRVVASNDDWTTFLALEDDETDRTAKALPGSVLVWRYLADSGLSLTFYEARKRRADVDFHWGGPERVARLSAEALSHLERIGFSESPQTLMRQARQVQAATLDPSEFRDFVATHLRLPAWRWLSSAYCREVSIENALELYPLAIDV